MIPLAYRLDHLLMYAAAVVRRVSHYLWCHRYHRVAAALDRVEEAVQSASFRLFHWIARHKPTQGDIPA